MYQYETRVQFSELNEEGYLSLARLVDYFQDAATSQAAENGITYEELKANNLAWMVNFWQIVINRCPEDWEDVVVGTMPYEFKKFLGMRNCFMKSASGEMLAMANSIWTLVDTEKLHPSRDYEKVVTKYVTEPRLDMDYAPRKISIPKDAEYREYEPFRVKRHNLDPNHHVNNSQYVVMAEDILPRHTRVRELRIEYKNAAKYDDMIYPKRCTVNDGEQYIVRLCDEKGADYVVVQVFTA